MDSLLFAQLFCSLSILIFIRSYITYLMRNRAINTISRISYGLLKEYRITVDKMNDSVKAVALLNVVKSTIDEYWQVVEDRSFSGQVFDLTIWTFNQFFPELNFEGDINGTNS